MAKHIIRNGIIAALLLSNVVIGYQFTATYNEQESKLKDKESKIQTLLDINLERNSLVEKQQNVIHTYEDEVLKLNNQIKTLKQDLVKAKQKNQSSP